MYAEISTQIGLVAKKKLKPQNCFPMFQNERVEYDAVQYFSDAGLGSADDVVMTDDQQKLIKVRFKFGCHEGGDGIAQW